MLEQKQAYRSAATSFFHSNHEAEPHFRHFLLIKVSREHGPRAPWDILMSVHSQVEIPAPAIVMILQFSCSLMYSAIPSTLISRRTLCWDSSAWSLSAESMSLNFWVRNLRSLSIPESSISDDSGETFCFSSSELPPKRTRTKESRGIQLARCLLCHRIVRDNRNGTTRKLDYLYFSPPMQRATI